MLRHFGATVVKKAFKADQIRALVKFVAPKTLTQVSSSDGNHRRRSSACSAGAATEPPPSSNDVFSALIGAFSETVAENPYESRDRISRETIFNLRDRLFQVGTSSDVIYSILDQNREVLFRYQGKESTTGFMMLLKQLNSRQGVALEVCNWRRKQTSHSFPMTSNEYAKAITIAGRSKNIDLAIQIFEEANNNRIKSVSTYNALMSAYMCNYLYKMCLSLFQDLKRQTSCHPSVVTYNIVISVYARLMHTKEMEATFEELVSLNMDPTLSTYNNLIAGYVTAWMWDAMERTFRTIKLKSIEPNDLTYLLILRGYAHAGKLEEMEEVYSVISNIVNAKAFPLARAMICAYCKSSHKNRVNRVESLLTHLPQTEHRPWLTVLLIKLYAQENMLEKMEERINEAFKHGTVVATTGLMRTIVTAYYRDDAVDRLAGFVTRAENAGWALCRSLYNCKMVMYGTQKRLREMELVLLEMDRRNMKRTKKTLYILYYAYLFSGCKHKINLLTAWLLKYGYSAPKNLSFS